MPAAAAAAATMTRSNDFAVQFKVSVVNHTWSVWWQRHLLCISYHHFYPHTYITEREQFLDITHKHTHRGTHTLIRRTHIHPHSLVGHVIMSITSCLSGTICPLIKPHTMWISVQSPCLAALHRTLLRVKTPCLKLHWFLFMHFLLLLCFFCHIKGNKQSGIACVMHDCSFLPAWIRVPVWFPHHT